MGDYYNQSFNFEPLVGRIENMNPSERRKYFEELRLQLKGKKDFTAPEKNILTSEMIARNIIGLNPGPRTAKPIPLGTVMSGEDALSLNRKFYYTGEDGSNPEDASISYNLEIPSSRWSKPADPIQGYMIWHCGKDGEPANVHRKVNPKFRGRGFGEAMLRLSEDAIRKLGYGKMVATTEKPATASWFFNHQYFAQGKGAHSLEYLQAIVDKETDYNKKFTDGVLVLKKVLN